MSFDERAVRRLVESASAQGLPEQVDNSATLAAVAALLRQDAEPSRSRNRAGP